MLVNLNIKDKRLVIPWDGREKLLVKMQTGQKNRHGSDSDVLQTIETRVNRRLSDIFSTLEKLPQGSTIVDIGSGNSLLDLAIQLIFPEKNFTFVLVDDADTFLTSENSNFYDSVEYKTYNEWSFVDKVIALNKFPNTSFITKRPEDTWCETADMVMSLSSWGWHYPVSVYLSRVDEILKRDGYIYVDPLLNIDNSYDKLSSMVLEVLIKIPHVYTGPVTFEHNNLVDKIDDMMNSGLLSKEEFFFTFLGKK
jgi:hypothetical protein